MAQSAGFQYLPVDSPAVPNLGSYHADWALLSKNQAFLQQPVFQNLDSTHAVLPAAIMWTDDFSNMFRLLK